MRVMTYLELFAGVGGMSLGFDRAGFRCVGHCEIEPFPRRVLSHRWPDTPLFGDVCELRGDQVESPTIVTFGAPCQDLSVAGKQAGLDGSRSILFYEGIRLWNETQAPYALYENVLGALSSNKGRDFAAILSAFVGSAVHVPADGWRGGGGVVSGRTGVAAWRVLDAQFFGVPQRRRRVFVLGARAGGVDPAEVLSIAESLSGDTPASREAREGVADTIAACLRSGGTIGFDGFNQSARTEAYHQLRTAADGGDCILQSPQAGVAIFPIQTPSVIEKGQGGVGVGQDGDPMFTLESRGHGVAVAFDNRPQINTSGVHDTLTTEGFVNPPSVLAYDARGNGDGNVVSTLPGDHLNRITDYTPIVMAVDKQSGQPESGSVAPTLKTDLSHDMGPVVFTKLQYGAYEDAPSVASTLGARDHAAQDTDIVVAPPLHASDGEKWGCNQWVKEGKAIVNGLPTPTTVGAMNGLKSWSAQTAADVSIRSEAGGRPRRLLPVECERLMGWPDGWTDVPDAKGKPASDSPRYKACGNGVATPVAHWIALQLRQAIEGTL